MLFAGERPRFAFSCPWERMEPNRMFDARSAGRAFHVSQGSTRSAFTVVMALAIHLECRAGLFSEAWEGS